MNSWFKYHGRLLWFISRLWALAKSNVPVKRKVLKFVLSCEETQFQNEIFEILPNMYENNYQSWAIFQYRPFSVHPYNRGIP